MILFASYLVLFCINIFIKVLETKDNLIFVSANVEIIRCISSRCSKSQISI